MISKKVIQSYVWYNDKCYFVSTIERDSSVIEYAERYNETIVWEYDYEKRVNEMITEWEDCKEVVEFAHRTGREKITYKKYLNIIRLFLSDLKELKKSSKDLIHEVVFKMYCPLVAKGVDKTILKEIAYDLLRQYGIEKISKGKAMDFKDEINKVNQSSYNNDRVVIVILVCIIAVLIIACLF